MDYTNSTVERRTSQAHDTVEAVAAKANQKLAPAIDRVARAAHETVDKVAQAAVPAADWINESAGQLRVQQEQLVESSRDYIRERPLLTVGFALAAGYLLGRLLRS
jgi:ElaB/YqjD/DUF883 family membrane-anchored ribosome-binding protein